MYIVTGGAGFIGSNLLKDLNEKGIEDILVVDSLGSSEKWRNLVGKKIADYCDKDDFLQRIEEGKGLADTIQGVLHMGACSSTTEKNAAYVMQTNYEYSKSLCRFCVSKNIPFIYASSAATYGEGESGFDDDPKIFDKLRPLNIYAYSKLLFDQWILANKLESKVVGLRFFNVYGPNEYHKEDMRSVVVKSFKQIQDGGRVSLFKSYRKEYADGEQKRDFIYVRDCTEVMCELLQQPEVSGIYNLGTGVARSWLDLTRAVFSSLNKEEAIDFIEMPDYLQPKYQYFTQASMGRLRQALPNWSPRSLEVGVSEYVQQYLLKSELTR